MKVYLKMDKTRVGLVKDVYCTAEGQKRMVVEFAHGTVDAEVSEFENV